MPTKQDSAIAAANQLEDIMRQAKALRESTAAWIARDASENYAAIWANLPTAALNADGTVSQTPDGTPNLANPITVPVGSPLYRSRNQLFSGRLWLIDFANFLGNAAVATSNRNPVIDDLVS